MALVRLERASEITSLEPLRPRSLMWAIYYAQKASLSLLHTLRSCSSMRHRCCPQGNNDGRLAALHRLAPSPVEVGGIEVDVVVAAVLQRLVPEGVRLLIDILIDATYL